MQIEQLSTSQFRVFISKEELEEREISCDELDNSRDDWHDHFYELLEEACDTLGVETFHHVSVELYSLQPHGIFLMITLLDDEIVNPVDESYMTSRVLQFQNFEDVVDLARRFPVSKRVKSALYQMNEFYWIILHTENIGLFALAYEYGKPSHITEYVLEEYGKKIMGEDAIEQLKYWFC
ncbi:MAG TPA: adaptor protein MecA [Bacillus sp. (in: firmicutes)]|uniref:adaptor protein MecA n=1 Tax=Bacillus litorisediminis TaxID=2922713 RepID=UPI001FABAA8D|nr:adaptor protein MecA [Bacillus litorisediminis]HWO75839.1 adaptor protein MecA [Bacillus sp. (in: firmicutes)]